jgi:hypothetical protein
LFGVHFSPFHRCHSAKVFVIIHNAIATGNAGALQFSFSIENGLFTLGRHQR